MPVGLYKPIDYKINIKPKGGLQVLVALTNRLSFYSNTAFIYSNISPAKAAQHIMRIGLMRINAMPMKLAMRINILTQKYQGLRSKVEKFSLLNNPKATAASISPTTAGRSPLIMLSITGDLTYRISNRQNTVAMMNDGSNNATNAVMLPSTAMPSPIPALCTTV